MYVNTTTGIRATRTGKTGRRRAIQITGIAWKPLLLVLAAAILISVNTALADHPSWQQHSRSYDVHLGVVPASVTAKDREMMRMHRTVGHGRHQHTAMTHHVMVSVYRRSTKEPLHDANITAELVENDLIHKRETEKQLELMPMGGMPSFCNFFDLHWNGKYRVNVTIREPGKPVEKVTFVQAVYGLPES